MRWKYVSAILVVLVAFGLFLLKQFNAGCVCNLQDVDLTDQVVIITGGNSGIGYETTKALALKNAQVIVASHDLSRVSSCIHKIKQETNNPNLRLHGMHLDLSSMSSVRDFVKQFKSMNLHRLDVLINNAGIWMRNRETTVDGFESTFAVNHLGHFLLTNLLLDEIKQAKGRVVTVSSTIHLRGVIDFDNLQSEKNYSDMSAYANSKLANVLFSNELARRLEGSGATSLSLHPGVIATGLQRQVVEEHPLIMWFLLDLLWSNIGKSVEGGAQTTICAAVKPKFNDMTGLYLAECDVETPNPLAMDEQLAKNLWEVSENLVGL